MPRENIVKLPQHWRNHSWWYAEHVAVPGYQDGTKSTALAFNDIENDVPTQAYSRMSECAFALYAGLDPDWSLNWGPVPEDGTDLFWLNQRWDVKSTAAGGRYLIWPVTKNHIYRKKEFDRLVLVTHADPLFHVIGWVCKGEFHLLHRVAGRSHKLLPGTWHLDKSFLRDLEEA